MSQGRPARAKGEERSRGARCREQLGVRRNQGEPEEAKCIQAGPG